MSESVSPIVLVVRGPTSPRREGELRRWLPALVPAARVLDSSRPLDLDAGGPAEVVTLTTEEVEAGPLAVAAVLARRRPARVREALDSGPLAA